MNRPDEATIAAAIFALLAARKPGASICPSEAARALADAEPDWRAILPAVRAAAAQLTAEGRLQMTQKGAPIDPTQAAGPVRLRLPTRP